MINHSRIALFITLLAVMLAGCGEAEAPAPEAVRPVRILTVDSAQSMITRQFPGKIQASGRVELAFELAGKIVSLPIKAGQEIKKGQLIAQLDDRDFLSSLKSAQSRADKARADLERYEKLLTEEVVSRSAYDQIKKEYDVALADAQIASKALQDTKIVAPFSGGIGEKFVENFQNVQAKQPIVSLLNDDIIEIGIDVPQDVAIAAQNASRIRSTTTFEALPGRIFELELKEYSREADAQTQTYHVSLFMPTPEDKTHMLPGMTTSVQLQYSDDTAEGFTIPAGAVLNEGGKTFVWKVSEDMTVKKAPVTVGMLNGEKITVTRGLTEGERIATAGVHYLREGQKVRELTGKIGE